MSLAGWVESAVVLFSIQKYSFQDKLAEMQMDCIISRKPPRSLSGKISSYERIHLLP